MNRLKELKKEIDQSILNSVKKNGADPKMLCASFCNDLPNSYYRWAWSDFYLPSGLLPLNNWIRENGFTKTTKKESTCVLFIGEKNECDLWVSVKKIWLTSL